MKDLPEDFSAWCDREQEAGRMADIDRGLLILTRRGQPQTGSEEETLLVLLMVAILSRARRDGHVLIDLDEVQHHPWVLSWKNRLPDPSRWEAILDAHPLVTGPGEGPSPFLYANRCLYFSALYRQESFLARSIRERLSLGAREPDARDQEILRLASGGVEDRRRLLEGALFRPFFLLTGGPGTGKTYTSAEILKVWKILRPEAHLVVATPTGKAARRFREALSLPEVDVLTLHRLLGISPGGASPGEDRPLVQDLVLVDECSMVDLSLMARLFRALSPETSVILVGDPDQLSSVGPGSVFGDLARAMSAEQKTRPEISRSFQVLTRNYRQDSWDDFGRLAEGVRQGDAGTVLEILASGEKSGPIRWIEPRTGAIREIGKTLIEAWLPVVESRSAEEAWEKLGQFALLGAVREGPLGTRTVNRLLRNHFENRSGCYRRFVPVIVTENSVESGFMNGDPGLLEMEGNTAIRAFFQGPGQTMRVASPLLMPAWEEAFALTVHKSQGSEFDHVTVLLGSESNALLSRSLLYTAVTRARKRLTVYASRGVLREALSNAGGRSTGLFQALLATGRKESAPG